MNKAFKQEMNSFVDILKKIQITKKPKVFCFYRQKNTKLVVIDKISLKVKRGVHEEILSFHYPEWNQGNMKLKIMN
ncbi:hypothetical protein [Sulfurimonas sp.]|uniref:hypothetical protein n=1 Tax=Sulfurimonas sp. TaxID=2022749 RepID=UPI003D09856A